MAAAGAAAFVLIILGCFAHRRVDQTLVVVVLYLGLLDGYVKLRTGSSTITLARDALVLSIAAGALLFTLRTKARLRLPPIGGLVAAFIAVVLSEIANPSGRGFAGSFAGIRQHLEFVPLFFLGYAFVRSEGQIRKGLWILVLCAAAGGVVSYWQSTLTPAELAAWGPGYSERVLGTGIFAGSGRTAAVEGITTVRPFGLGSDLGSGAAVAALALPGLIAVAMTVGGWRRWALSPLAAGVGLAVATSGSRTAIVITLVTLIVFGLLAAASRNAVKAMVGIALATALMYAVFGQLGPDNPTSKRAQSISPAQARSTFALERGDSVSAFGPILMNHPLGVGLGVVGPASGFRATGTAHAFNAETQWNFLLVETGVGGIAIYLLLLARLMWLAITRVRQMLRPALRLYLAALAAPIFGMTVAGFSGPTSASVPNAPYLWLVAGVLSYWLVTVVDEQRRDRDPAASSGPAVKRAVT
jgi:hypothetical protein